MLLGFFKFVLPLMEVFGTSRVGQISHMEISTVEDTFEISNGITLK